LRATRKKRRGALKKPAMIGSRAEAGAEIFASIADWKSATLEDRTEYSATSWLRSM
jgi:hypothetical protein